MRSAGAAALSGSEQQAPVLQQQDVDIIRGGPGLASRLGAPLLYAADRGQGAMLALKLRTSTHMSRGLPHLPVHAVRLAARLRSVANPACSLPPSWHAQAGEGGPNHYSPT